jgi:hypothetical protein
MDKEVYCHVLTRTLVEFRFLKKGKNKTEKNLLS